MIMSISTGIVSGEVIYSFSSSILFSHHHVDSDSFDSAQIYDLVGSSGQL